MQHRVRRSELELRGSRIGLKIGFRSSRGVHSAPCATQNPDLPTNMWIEGVRGRELATSRTPICNPLICNPRSPW
eukprot:11828034-Alexandrium_andersonii.AAC.1